jgi:hypothetical protein
MIKKCKIISSYTSFPTQGNKKNHTHPPEKTRKQEISSFFYLLIPATVHHQYIVRPHLMIVAPLRCLIVKDS